MNHKQLYKVLDDDFKMWGSYNPITKNLRIKEASRIPFLRYPDGVPCTEANMYMLGYYNRGYSRKVDGGTLKTYAQQISPLIRYCYNNGLAFTALTDSRFELFIRGLEAELDEKGDRIKSANTVIDIGKRCIEFLMSVASFHDDGTLIGEEEFHAIQIIKKTKEKKLKDGKTETVTYYWHNSFPKPDSKNRRLPLSHKAAAAIKEQIYKKESPDVRERDLMLYETYEQTGARRTEAVLLQLKHVRAALNKVKEGRFEGDTVGLEFTTLKKQGGETTRLVPVTVTYLFNLKDYIQKCRKKVIKRAIRHTKDRLAKGEKVKKPLFEDHGFVFIDVNNGTILKSDTISTIFNNYKRGSGIEDGFFAHLIRHAFVTERMKDLIVLHDFNTPDEFKKALFNTEQFKMQLQQWTGHEALESLDTYIHIAFGDLAEVKKVYKAVALKSAVTVVKGRLGAMAADLKESRVKPNEILEMMSSLIEGFEIDIDNAIERNAETPNNNDSEEERNPCLNLQR
ncbi:hypothetical protein [Vibrio sp. YYF0003]|uniref:hypothetical protein n=1 Tax=Vibrio sp. YYF0003 TaxID=3116646 RepID=UPI002EB5A6A7|nr:hypothetical protein [Vibrio sp. YYF0003]